MYTSFICVFQKNLDETLNISCFIPSHAGVHLYKVFAKERKALKFINRIVNLNEFMNVQQPRLVKY